MDATPNTSVYIKINSSATQNVTSNNEVSKIDPSFFLAAAVYLTIIGIIATVGNLTVLFVILRDKKLRNKPHNLLLISVALCDLGVLFGGYPFTITSGYNQAWMFGQTVCKFAGFWTFFLSQTNMNTLVAVCVYRYIMICAPGKAFLLSKKATAYVILGTTGHGLFWTALPLMGWGSYGQEPFVISCSLDWARHDFSSNTYMVATIFFCYVIHIIVMTNCYRHISKTVGNLVSRDRERGRRIVGIEEMLHNAKVADDQQVTRMCFLVVIVFVGVWTPYTVVCAIHIFYEDMPIAVTALPTLCAKAGCMLNPLVYFATNRSFRKKTLELLGCIKQDNTVGVEVPRYGGEGSVVEGIGENGHRAISWCRNCGRVQRDGICTREVVRNYDKISKDGVYLGRDTIVVEQTVTMF